MLEKDKYGLKINKLTLIRVSILELSEVLMYEFHYNYTKHEYGNKAALFFTDTDNLIYEIKTENVFEDFFKTKELLISARIQKIQNVMMKNNLILGQLKGLRYGMPIKSSVGLYLYNEKTKHKNEKVTGINSSAVADELK